MGRSEEYRKNAVTSIRRKLSFKRSERTVSTYVSCLVELFKHYPDLAPSKISVDQFERFLFNKLTKGISDSKQNHYLSSFKFYQTEVLNRNSGIKQLDRMRPKRKKHLPKPLSEDQIKKGFSRINNTKHRTYCLLMYATGLRISELLNLRMGDFNKGEIRVIGKGDKERVLVYGEIVKQQLIDYYLNYKIADYLFPNYSPSSVRKVVRKYFNCTPHQLRHSFATHSLDHGKSLRAIQEELGHSSSRTTEVYTLVSVKHKKEAYKPETILLTNG